MERPKLLYIYDPLCGWCYGFSSVVKKIWENYGDRMDCEVLSGGMAIGPRALPIGKGYGFIGRSLAVVERTTGVKFGEGFKKLVEDGTYMYNSELPCIAMTVFRTYEPKRVVEFAHDLQRAFFYDGCDMNEPDTYRALVQPYGISPDEFTAQLQDDANRTATYEEFDMVSAMGADGFPTLVYIHGEGGIALARGYRAYEEIEPVLEKLLP